MAIATRTLVRIQHEGIPVKDLETSRRFYEDVLGLVSIPRPALGPGVWLSDASGSPQMHLIVSKVEVPGPDAKPQPTGRHTAFLVEDYAGLKHRLTDKGIYWWELENSPAGVGQLFCCDPDGHTLEFQPVEHYGDGTFTPGFEPGKSSAPAL